MRSPAALRVLVIPFFVGSLLASAGAAAAANYPLEVTNIKPAGGLNSSSRIYRAYPGLEYNIRAAVVGGAYPYNFSLAGAPAGMTVDDRGTISWTNPQASATPTLTVRDSEGSRVSVTWTIGVSTAGFRFVNGVGGQAAPTGTGTLTNPWRTLSDVYYNTGPTDIVYFRAATYNQLSLPRTSVGTAWERVEWSYKSIMWLAYPGERPVLDFGYRAGAEPGPIARLNSSSGNPYPYIDGFEATNIGIIGFQVSSPGTFRRLRMHDLLLGGDGTNAAFIMTLTQPTPVVGLVIQDSEFYNVPAGAVTIKIYAQEKLLIEDTVHRNADVGVELKNDIRRYTVRANTFYAFTKTALGGNMHTATTNGEICFNYITGSPVTLDLNQDGMAGLTYVYRNTFVGRVRVRNTDSADGPFRFNNNVIVNSDPGSHVYFESVTDTSRVVFGNNLVGYPSANIVDGSGRLTAAYASYVGVHGFQTSLTGGNTPSAPTNVSIR